VSSAEEQLVFEKAADARVGIFGSASEIETLL
jgi:hypothetical protein